MKRRHPTLSPWFMPVAACFVLGAWLYASWPLGFVLDPAAMRSGLASELGATGAPYAWLFNGFDVVSGILLTIGAVMIWRRWHLGRLARAALAGSIVYGLCGGLDAVLPESCLPSRQTCGPILADPMLVLHGAFDFAGSAALIVTFVCLLVLSRRRARSWSPWLYIVGCGGIAFALVSLYFIFEPGPGYLAQRFYLTLSSLLVTSIPWILRASTMVHRVETTGPARESDEEIRPA